MGLDMYLNKKTYVQNWDHMSDEEKHQITVHKNHQPVDHIKPERIAYIEEQVGYWRKANAIHKWFVDHVQDGVDNCQSALVELERLKELYDLCKQVKENHDLAPELLPSESGFFFGSTDYDEWYFNDIDHTIQILEEIFEIEKDDNPESEWDWHYKGEYYYQSSW